MESRRWLRIAALTLHLSLRRHKAKFLVLVLVLVLASLFFVFRKSWLREGVKTYNFGFVTDSQTKNELPLEIQKLLSRGLTRLDSSGQPQPGLAASWEVNEAGDEYRFKLRNSLFWTDGSPLNPAEVRFDIPGSQVQVEGENTLVFKLKNPYSPFPSVVAKPLLKNETIGIGPYQVVAYQKVNDVFESITLSGNRVLFKIKFYPTDEVARTALKLGEIDGLFGVRDPGDLSDWPTLIAITYYPKNRFVGVFYNTNDKILGDKEVRQALSYAIPHEFPGKPASSPIDPNSWAYNPDSKTYDFDLAKAQELLVGTSSARLTLTTLSVYENLGKKIVKSWQSLGLAASLEVVNSVPRTQGSFQILLIGQKVPDDPDQYSLWHSTQRTNITGYTSLRVDKILEDARKTTDLEKRKELYYSFQKYFIEDVPVSVLYLPEEYIFFNKRAKNPAVQQLVGDLIS